MLAAFSVSGNDIKRPDDFFVAFKQVGVTAFSSSSVAYNFQVSTIYPFLLWGLTDVYLIPIVNTLCIGIGILLFYWTYPKFRQFIGKDITLHGIIGEKYGNTVRIITSYLTIIAFLGFSISETYYGSKVMFAIVDNKNIVYLLIMGVLVLVYAYIAYGGQLSSIRTDQFQLIISYIGIFGIMIYLILIVIIKSTFIPAVLYWGLFVLCIYILLIFTLRRFRFIKISENNLFWNKVTNFLLNGLVVTAFGLLFLGAGEIVITKNPMADVKSFFNLKDFGISGLLSFILLPLSFQFVDLSNWQRLLSVKGDVVTDDFLLRKNIKRGLLTYAFESPFTWIIFIFFGLLVITALPHFTINDLLVDMPRNLIASRDPQQRVLGYVFVLSIISIMLSTIDSFLMAIIFTFVYDAYPVTRKLLDKKNNSEITQNAKAIINSGKVFGIVVIIAGIILFILFDKVIPNGGEMFISLLLAFYTAQLAFLPHILGVLFLKKHPSKFWAASSMLLGSIIGIALGIYSVIWQPKWAFWPVPVCLSISFLIYIIGYLFTNIKIRSVVSTAKLFINKAFKSTMLLLKKIVKSVWFAILFGVTIYVIFFYHDCTIKVKIIEFSAFIGLYILFFIVFIRPKGLMNKFYDINTFYCDLMFYMVITLVDANVHIFNQASPNFDYAAKSWEVASYLVTLIYTLVFWRNKHKNGKKIISHIEAKKESDGVTPKVNVSDRIWWTLSVLLFISIIHTMILFEKPIAHLLTGNSTVQEGSFLYLINEFPTIATILLIVITYALFLNINLMVINHCEDTPYYEDFRIGMRYIDLPVLIIFCCLLIYSIFIAFTKDPTAMNGFFSGAIAFELLLSSMCWANTDMFKPKKVNNGNMRV
jgi:Na+/proline symporter